MLSQLHYTFVCAMTLLALLGTEAAQAAPLPQGPVPPAQMLGQLTQANPQTRVSYHAKTGKVRFIGSSTGKPLAVSSALRSIGTAQDAAKAFLGSYGTLFGLRTPATELRIARTTSAGGGRSATHFQQVYNGVPVLGGELVVQTDAASNVLAANGEALPNLQLNVVPTIAARAAQERAVAHIARGYNVQSTRLRASTPQLWIYEPTLLGGPGLRRPALVWRTEVAATGLDPIRELVLVDAHKGVAALNFNQIANVRNRRTYNANSEPNLPGTLVCSETTNPCSPSETDAAKAHLYGGQVYDFFKNQFGRDSIDNKGMPIIQTVDYCPEDFFECPYANAYWSGTQMVYGDTYASADDVIGHELAHGVTQYESNLFYYYQAGAINESMSDVFGELFDLQNGAGDDSAAVRWEIGEDLPIGAIRNMKNPPAFDEPDRMRSPLYTEDIDDITRQQTDAGGVHTNSGVSNKAAALMADGGTFNGRTIRGLGLIKTGRIYYETNTNLLTSGSDYMDLYDALQQACANLIGTAGITSSDCAEVKKVVDATEMNLQPVAVEARAVEAPMCDTGRVPTDLFFDNMENTASGNWIKQAPVVGDNHFYYPQNSHTIPDVDTTYTTSGRFNIWGDNAGVDFLEGGFDPKDADFSIAMSKSVAVPAGAFMRFNHAYGFEDFVVPNITEMYMDGGVVEYSTNNGTTWTDAKALFANNGYNGKIQGDNLNPLSGRSAFVGQSHGYYSSRLNLAALAGKSVRFRYRMGIDAFGGDYGWFIDDVRIYTCAAPQGGASGNLLRNPGFEIDANNDTRPDGWTPINATVTRIDTVKHGGTYSMRHTTAADATYNLAQIVGNVQGGAPYAFSGWVNIPTTSDQFGFTFNVAWYNAASKVISTSAVKSYTAHTSGVWNRVSAQLTAPAGTVRAVVQMSVAGLKGMVYVDDLFFGNMVANGGFEQDINSDNTPDGWTRNVNALRTTDASRSGGYGLRHNAGDNSSYTVEQNIKGITAGQSYTLGAAVNIPQTADAFTFRFMVRWRNAANGTISVSAVRSLTSHTSGAWRPVSGTVRAPAGATSADVQMVVDNLNGTVLVDDVNLQP